MLEENIYFIISLGVFLATMFAVVKISTTELQ